MDETFKTNTEIKKDKIEILKQTKKEFKKIYIGRIKPKKNHQLFEFNKITNEIRLAVFDCPDEINYVDATNKLISKNKKVTINENCIYISALNKKNALKKILS